MNKIRIPSYIFLLSSFLFSVTSLSFHFDVSSVAFLLNVSFTAVMFYFIYFKLLKAENLKYLKIVEKFLQYAPFVFLTSFIIRRAGNFSTSLVYDFITVFLWCSEFVCSLVILYFLNDKRVSRFFPEYNSGDKKKKSVLITPEISVKKILFELLDWIDALVQAVFMVLLIQIFVLQLYVIPSESMVPSFLIKDRVVVTKTLSGPKFPLSEVGIPCLKRYKRGDVIVFRNPHYSMDRKSEVKTVIAQIVYMLTFTNVNLNVDEHGEPKADPLVKRICGLPGEQLVMQDGILYKRTSKDSKFVPVELDKKFAAWNLNAFSTTLKNGIQVYPLSQDEYKTMLEIEENRRDLDLYSASKECEDIFNSFKYLCKRKDFSENTEFSLFEYDLFSDFYGITKKILNNSINCESWFKPFMTDWYQSGRLGKSFSYTSGFYQKNYDNYQSSKNSLEVFGYDYYAEANYKLNVMVKLCAGKLYLKTADLINKGYSEKDIYEDPEIKSLLKQASDLHFYILILDQRNMPVFPENDADGNPVYIPENCYFMMGDNRFNSLDMRHSYDESAVSLTNFDEFSVKYFSNMKPQYVNKKYILGSASYRFWPLFRAGSVKTK